MPASVVEKKQALAASVAIVATPEPTDMLILVGLYMGGNPNTTTVTGCGATWSRIGQVSSMADFSYGGYQQSSQDIWKGVAPSSAGTIVATPPGGLESAIGVSATLVRGGSDAAVVAVQGFLNGAANPRLGPSQDAQAGQLVLAHGNTLNSGGPAFFSASGAIPASDWLTPVVIGNIGSWSRAWYSYRLPSEGVPTPHSVSISGDGFYGSAISQVVVGGASSSPGLLVPGIRMK